MWLFPYIQKSKWSPTSHYKLRYRGSVSLRIHINMFSKQKGRPEGNRVR